MKPQDTIAHIPLRARDGSIRDYAIIDAEDLPLVSCRRWCLDGNNYAAAMIRINGIGYKVKMHRLLLGLQPGDKMNGDHINRNRLDNRKSNLRILTKKENSKNMSKFRDSTSSYRGVFWDKQSNRWRANITVDGKQTRIGIFKNELDAAHAAREARMHLMPFAID